MNAAWWYANRAAGLVAWALLAASMLVGLMLSTKVAGKRVRPNWIQDLHRGLSGLAVAFVGVHVAAAIGDSFIHFGAADVLVPGASGWRPWAIAWGIVSMYLMVAVEGSSLLRKHLPKHVWRKLHYLSFPLFITATTHALTAGTDMGTTAGIAAVSLVSAGLVALTTLRVADEMGKAKAGPPARPTTTRPAPAPAPAPAQKPMVGAGRRF
ncbi:MAG: putative rane protein [Acidimicrobiales bacterium]|nr:putative rane protein [Acidimicrobiales bacterium]